MKRLLAVVVLALAAVSAHAQPQPGGGLPPNFAQPSPSNPFGQPPKFSSAPVTSTSPAVNISTAPKPFDVHASTPGFYLFGGPEPAVKGSTTTRKAAREPLV